MRPTCSCVDAAVKTYDVIRFESLQSGSESASCADGSSSSRSNWDDRFFMNLFVFFKGLLVTLKQERTVAVYVRRVIIDAPLSCLLISSSSVCSEVRPDPPEEHVRLQQRQLQHRELSGDAAQREWLLTAGLLTSSH